MYTSVCAFAFHLRGAKSSLRRGACATSKRVGHGLGTRFDTTLHRNSGHKRKLTKVHVDLHCHESRCVKPVRAFSVTTASLLAMLCCVVFWTSGNAERVQLTDQPSCLSSVMIKSRNFVNMLLVSGHRSIGLASTLQMRSLPTTSVCMSCGGPELGEP